MMLLGLIMLVNHLVILIVLLVFLTGAYFVFNQNRKLKTIKNKAHDLHHDINSSLVILKLTIESLKDIPIGSTLTEGTSLISLISLIEEGVSQIEGSFRHWNVSN